MPQPSARKATGNRKPGVCASLWVGGFTLFLLAAAAASPSARTEDSAGDTTSAVRRFLALREEPLRQYRAYRRLHAACDRVDQQGWVEAWTEYDERGFRYQIVAEAGSESVRNKVLKAVLHREQEIVARGEDMRGELTASNYYFEDAIDDGTRTILLKPKRKDVMLVDGRMVLSPDGRDLLRVEGRLAKNPSFWTSLVNVIRHYARVDGVRVPVAVESVAKVKFVGMSRMDMHYEYETINGRPVNLAARRIPFPR